MQEKLTALVIGATGLVGKELVALLARHPGFERVLCFVRKPSGHSFDRLEEIVVDFDRPDDWADRLRGDVLFSAMGTTIKNAGSQEAQWRIDFDYQYQTAERAAKNGTKALVLVSSLGADSLSRMFYSRMKGQLDNDVARLGFEKTVILRPSVLDGERSESRPAERVGIWLGRLLGYVPGLRKYKAIPAATVARAMVNAALAKQESPCRIIEAEALFAEADEGR